MGISADWLGTSEVEKDLTGLSGIKRELAAVSFFSFFLEKLQISALLNDCCEEKGLTSPETSTGSAEGKCIGTKNTHLPCLSAVKLLVRGLYFFPGC